MSWQVCWQGKVRPDGSDGFEKLAPCPFCGGAPELKQLWGLGGWFAWCTEKSCQARESRDDAVRAWNRRFIQSSAEPDQVPKEVAEMVRNYCQDKVHGMGLQLDADDKTALAWAIRQQL